MQCLELPRWMSLRLDGRLPVAEERLLQEHIDACPSCSLVWQRWQDIDSLLAEAAVLQPPEDLAARVMVRIRRRPQRGTLDEGLAVVLFGLVALVCALGLPLLVGVCLLGATAAGSMSVLPALAKGALQVLEVARTVGEAARLFLWAVLNSRTVMAAVAYAGVAGATVAVWLRLVVFRQAAAGARQDSAT